MTKFKKFKIILPLSIFCFLFSVPSGALAARLYFVPQELVIGTEKEFSIVLNIDAAAPVNAFQVAVAVPSELVPVDVSEANSIINFWVEKSHFDELTRLLIFSGITPGGFQGEKAPLLIVKFKTAKQEGQAILAFNKEKTKIYLHTAQGIEDSLILESLNLPIVKGKENIGAQNIDSEPPEEFRPEVAQNSDMFDGKYFLVFATQDKGSGIANYAIYESRRPEKRLATAGWQEAESPYALKDQKLKSYIYVKAVDKAGNERITVVEPRYPLKWYEIWRIWSIVILGLFVLAVIGKILWKKRRK